MGRRVPFLVCLALCACEPVPPQSLDELDLPEDFRLDTSHDVTFRILGTPQGWVDVRLESGDPLVRGDAASAARDPIVLHVPYGTEVLIATLRAPDGQETTWAVPVADGVAEWDVEASP